MLPKCPLCGWQKRKATFASMRDHMRDKHGITGRRPWKSAAGATDGTKVAKRGELLCHGKGQRP